MEILGARPAWSKTSSERLLTLDAVETELARLKTVRLHYLASVDESGDAQELGASDTVELLSLRHNRHPREVRRDLTLAKALPKYPAVSAALPDLDPAATSTITSPATPTSTVTLSLSRTLPRTPTSTRRVPSTRTATPMRTGAATPMRTGAATAMRTAMRTVPLTRARGCGGGW